MGRTHRICCARCRSTYRDGTEEIGSGAALPDILDSRKVQVARTSGTYSFSNNSGTLAGSHDALGAVIFAYDDGTGVKPTQAEVIAWAKTLGPFNTQVFATLFSLWLPGLSAWNVQATDDAGGLYAAIANRPDLVSGFAWLQQIPGGSWPNPDPTTIRWDLERDRGVLTLADPVAPTQYTGTSTTDSEALEFFADPLHLPSYNGPADPCCAAFARPPAAASAPLAGSRLGPDPREFVGMGGAANRGGCCG